MNAPKTFFHLLKKDVFQHKWIWIFFAVYLVVILPPFLIFDADYLSLFFGTDFAKNDIAFCLCALALISPALAILAFNSDPTGTTDSFWMTRPISGTTLFSEKMFLFVGNIGTSVCIVFHFVQEVFFVSPFLWITLLIVSFLIVSAVFQKHLRLLLLLPWSCFGLMFIMNFNFWDRLEMLSLEPMRLSQLPSVFSLWFPIVAFLTIAWHEYVTHNTKRSGKLLIGAVAISVTLVSLLPLEWLKLEPALDGKIVATGKGERVAFAEEDKKDFPNLPNVAKFSYYSSPDKTPEFFWTAYANNNPEALLYEWVKKEQRPLNLFSRFSSSPHCKRLYNDIYSGAVSFVNQDLSNPRWDVPLVSASTVFFRYDGDKKAKTKKVSVILEEWRIRRVAEMSIKEGNKQYIRKNNHVGFSGNAVYALYNIRENGRIYEIASFYSQFGASGFANLAQFVKEEYLIVLVNPVRKEAHPIYLYGYTKVHDLDKPGMWSKDSAWLKDAHVVIYHMKKTGNRGRTFVDVSLGDGTDSIPTKVLQ